MKTLNLPPQLLLGPSELTRACRRAVPMVEERAREYQPLHPRVAEMAREYQRLRPQLEEMTREMAREYQRLRPRVEEMAREMASEYQRLRPWVEEMATEYQQAVQRVRSSLVHGSRLEDLVRFQRFNSDPEYRELVLSQVMDDLAIRPPPSRVERTPARHLTAGAVANGTFGLLELVVPRRIAEEELGDAAETVRSLSLRGEPPWKIYLKIATTIFWVSINALREVTSALLGRLRRS